MKINELQLRNFTVFEVLDLDFSRGINVFVGENGFGKTHIMKVLYSACCASHPGTSFSQKMVKCFLPDDYRISRLIRRKRGVDASSVKVTSTVDESGASKVLMMEMNTKTKKWGADVRGEEEWEMSQASAGTVFIPAKEILSNAYNLNAAVEKNNVIFDETYLDLLNSARVDISNGADSKEKERRLKQIESITSGKVVYDSKRDEFYLGKLEFPLIAEGTRKIALLWQLIKNGTLEKGSVLFWDEPEANLNPAMVPLIVDILLELSREGVQVFISTHDYFLAKYFEIRSMEDEVRYYSLYRSEKNTVTCEVSSSFTALDHNAIMDTFMQLYHEEVRKAME